MALIFHADDYGLTINQAQRIIALTNSGENKGRLSSVSIFANSPSFEECANLIKPLVDANEMLLTLHLNIVEGPCCTPACEVPLLVDERGMFNLSFIRTFYESNYKKNEDLLVQISLEFISQIERFLEAFPDQKYTLRLDSHQHFHMIPLVYHALRLALENLAIQPDHIRIPIEETSYLKSSPGLIKKIKPVNFAKHKLLSKLWKQCQKQPIPTNLETNYFCGIIFSSHMEDIPDSALSALNQHALRFGRQTEVLYHPIGLDSTEIALDEHKKDFVAFHRSPHRKQEAQALLRPGFPV
jgi:chitin disaccharide deacetylase